MTEQSAMVAVLQWLEHRTSPMRATVIAEKLGLPTECVYSVLVNLYDNKMARIAREPVTGAIAGWEAA